MADGRTDGRTDAPGDDNRHPPKFWLRPKNLSPVTLHHLAAATSGLMTITTTSDAPGTKYRRNADRSDFDARSSLETVSLVLMGSVVLLTPAVVSSYIVCILIHVMTISGNGLNVKEEKYVSWSAYITIYKSVKLTTAISKMDTLLSDKFPWPHGVHVRR